MLEELGFPASLRILVFLMLSFAFFVGIMLTVSQEAFEYFNRALQREYGIKKRLVPKLEQPMHSVVDWVILKYRLVAGLLIAICAYILLLIYKF